jgi:hypothetical protein
MTGGNICLTTRDPKERSPGAGLRAAFVSLRAFRALPRGAYSGSAWRRAQTF